MWGRATGLLEKIPKYILLAQLTERTRQPFWRLSWNSPLPATFFNLK